MKLTGQTEEQRAGKLAAWRKDVAFISRPEFESLLVRPGFGTPTPFHQALLIRAWFVRSP